MACGNKSAMASNDSRAPRGLPGRLTIKVRPRTPATARDKTARGVFLRPSARINSAIPGKSFWQAWVVASGVESRGPIPVPPVVRIKSAAPLSASEMRRSRIAAGSSASSDSETICQPNCAQRSRRPGPEASLCVPRETESLTVSYAHGVSSTDFSRGFHKTRLQYAAWKNWRKPTD